LDRRRVDIGAAEPRSGAGRFGANVRSLWFAHPDTR